MIHVQLLKHEDRVGNKICTRRRHIFTFCLLFFISPSSFFTIIDFTCLFNLHSAVHCNLLSIKKKERQHRIVIKAPRMKIYNVVVKI